MLFKVELAAFERAYIGQMLVQNGARRWMFFIDSEKVEVVRSRHFIAEGEADTPAKTLYVAILKAFIVGRTIHREFISLSRPVREANPSASVVLAEVFNYVLEGKPSRALQSLRGLIVEEAEAAALRAGTPAPAIFQHTRVIPPDYVPSRDEARRQAGLAHEQRTLPPQITSTWTRDSVHRGLQRA
jgi:flagellar biosynthesis regulator FlbT